MSGWSNNNNNIDFNKILSIKFMLNKPFARLNFEEERRKEVGIKIVSLQKQKTKLHGKVNRESAKKLNCMVYICSLNQTKTYI